MMTFFDHLLELRSKILLSFFAVALGAALAHVYHDALIAFILQPLDGKELFFLSPLDPLLFVLKTDVFVGLILALPVLSWNALSFIRPAMQESSWLLVSVAYCVAAVLLVGGLAYAYFVMVPMSLAFLMSIHVAGIDNMVTAHSYLNFLLVQSLIVAILFQIPLFIIAGSYIGAFDIDTLASKRRYIYVGGFIALAIATPTTDLFNLAIVSLPACLIFEGSVVVAKVVNRIGRRRGDKEGAPGSVLQEATAPAVDQSESEAIG